MEQPDDVAAREAEETLFGGYFLTAAFVSNPTFTARPDNTGLVGLRHMLHLETDLYKWWSHLCRSLSGSWPKSQLGREYWGIPPQEESVSVAFRARAVLTPSR